MEGLNFRKRVDLLKVKSISRFNRNTVDLLQTINELRWLGIEVIFNEENLSSKDRVSDLIRALSASIAQAESESLSESIKWGLKRGFELEHQSFMLEHVLGINTAKKPS